jgi:hypothetical protein
MGADERGVTRRYGRRLQQVGAGLFLLGLLVGLAVPRFALPRLALSTHLLGLMQGLFLLVAGGVVAASAALRSAVARWARRGRGWLCRGVGRQPGWCFVGRGEHDGAAGCGRGSRHRAAGGRHQAPPLVGCAVSHRDRGAPPLGPAWVPRVGVGDAVETRGGAALGGGRPRRVLDRRLSVVSCAKEGQRTTSGSCWNAESAGPRRLTKRRASAGAWSERC